MLQDIKDNQNVTPDMGQNLDLANSRKLNNK